MENNLEFWLKKLNCNQKELGKYLSVTEQQISNHWKRKGIPEKYIQQLEKILMERQRNVRKNEVVDSDAVVSTPLAQSEFKPVIPSELYNKLDCDIDFTS